MFRNVLGFFRGTESLQVDKTGNPSEEDIHLAAVALMVEVACVDQEFHLHELNAIIALAGREFGIADKEAADLLEMARFSSENTDRLDEFIAVVNDNFSVVQKQRLLGLVWKVIVSDGRIDPAESEHAALLRKKLSLTLEQAVRAQQMGYEKS